MGWQIGFRWGGQYYCFVVLVVGSEEAIKKAKGEAMLAPDTKVEDLTCIKADGCVYKA